MSLKTIIKRSIKLFIPDKVCKFEVNSLSPNELLRNRCALITGGTSGIGLAIAKAFINSGAYVIITGRSQDRLNLAISQLPEGKCYGVILDNKDVESFHSIIRIIHDVIGNIGYNHIDILVNNAGINGEGMPNANVNEFNDIINTNLRGAFFLSQLFGKYFITNNIRGNILNISSASSIRPADSAYSLSKWGLRGLTMGLAKSLGTHGITVNGIAPGPTATPMMVKNTESNLYLERIPLGRYIMPEEIADMAVILVSSLGKSIMGDTIFMTGGAANLTYDDVKYEF